MSSSERSGIHLGSIAGTSIQVEVSFIILIGLFVLMDLQSHVPVERALLWIPVLFLSILLHELGHAAIIGIFGFGSSRISLAGFGGFTLNVRKARPWQEILISLAGPISSALIALGATLVMATVPIASSDPMLRQFFPLLQWANIAWAIFNLVPIHPLDGGQALRNLARIFTKERTAITLSVWISMILGGLLVVFGLFRRDYFLLIIAGLLTMQNYQEWTVIRSIPR
ncbi:MAG: M50 family metallopeptidase [Acidobacteriota bacterium]